MGAGSACRAQPAAGREVPMGSDTLYNEQALLWGVVRFVQAVSCVRRTPRPVGANCMQAQPAARKRVQAQPAGRASPLLCAPTAFAGRGGSYGEWCASFGL